MVSTLLLVSIDIDGGVAEHLLVASQKLFSPLVSEDSLIKLIPGDTSSSDSLDTAKKWIERCTQGHPDCGPGNRQRLPTRVIDVGSSTSEVRLYETKGEIERYAALSHCWGKVKLLRTLKENVAQLTKGIPWASLPKTFRDAIDFTRRLGLRWIWIDSLCIIQDDSDDWQKEAAQMADIYQHAYVTLAATTSGDSSGGLYTNQSHEKHRPQKLSVVNDIDDSDCSLYTALKIDHVEESSRKFPLVGRAWVYQERLLSARVLHFAGYELNWECRSASWCECGRLEKGLPSGMPPKIEFMGHLEQNAASDEQDTAPEGSEVPKIGWRLYRKQLPTRHDYNTTSQQWTPKEKVWRQMVRDYLGLGLTVPKDIFPALAGVAKVWNIHTDDQYLAGLWRKSLLQDLCWGMDSPKTRIKDWRAPSWSWASIPAEGVNASGIMFDSNRTRLPGQMVSAAKYTTNGSDDWEDVAEILDAKCTPVGTDPAGQLVSGQIVLASQALPGTIIYWPKGTSKSLSNIQQFIWLMVGNMSFFVTTTSGLQLDEHLGSRESSYSAPVEVVRITDFTREGYFPDMACLLLRPSPSASDEGEVEYERVGYIRMIPQSIHSITSLSQEKWDLTKHPYDLFHEHKQEINQTQEEARQRHGVTKDWFAESDTRFVYMDDLKRLKQKFEETGRQIFKIV
jgi:hypothetical protein